MRADVWREAFGGNPEFQQFPADSIRKMRSTTMDDVPEFGDIDISEIEAAEDKKVTLTRREDAEPRSPASSSGRREGQQERTISTSRWSSQQWDDKQSWYARGSQPTYRQGDDWHRDERGGGSWSSKVKANLVTTKAATTRDMAKITMSQRMIATKGRGMTGGGDKLLSLVGPP